MRNVNVFFILAIFFAPLMFFSLGSVSLFKFFSTLGLLFLGIKYLTHPIKISDVRNKYWNVLIIFFCYSILIEIFMGIVGIFLYSDFPSDGGSYPLSRFLVQLYSNILIISIAGVIYYSTIINPQVVIKPLLLSIKILLLVAFYELLSFYFALPILPMYLSGGVSEVNQNISEVLSTGRLHSLAGEPRFFSALLAVTSNTLLFCFVKFKKKWHFKKCFLVLFMYIFIIFCNLYTQSTSGFLLTAILLIISFPLFFGFSSRAAMGIVVPFLLITLFLSPIIIDVIQARVFDRISQEVLSLDNVGAWDYAYVDVPFLGMMSFDATDATPFVLLIEKPFFILTGVGFGNVSTFVKPYLPSYGGYWGYGYTGIVEPNLGFIKALANYGLMGNIILLYLYGKFYLNYRKFHKNYSTIQLISFYTLTGVFISSLSIASPMLIPLWFFAFHCAILDKKYYFQNPTI